MKYEEFMRMVELFAPILGEEEAYAKEQSQYQTMRWFFAQIIKSIEGNEDAIRVQNELMKVEGNSDAIELLRQLKLKGVRV